MTEFHQDVFVPPPESGTVVLPAGFVPNARQPRMALGVVDPNEQGFSFKIMDTETHQSHGPIVVHCKQTGEWRMMQEVGHRRFVTVGYCKWLVFTRMDDPTVSYVHPPHAEGFRFVGVHP